jgi:hypothetical protein
VSRLYLYTADSRRAAKQLGYGYVVDAASAVEPLEAGFPVVVPTGDLAEEVLRLLGAPEPWIQEHCSGALRWNRLLG